MPVGAVIGRILPDADGRAPLGSDGDADRNIRRIVEGAAEDNGYLVARGVGVRIRGREADDRREARASSGQPRRRLLDKKDRYGGGGGACAERGCASLAEDVEKLVGQPGSLVPGQ